MEIIGYIALALFAALMSAGAWNTITHGGEAENICKYTYNEEENEK